MSKIFNRSVLLHVLVVALIVVALCANQSQIRKLRGDLMITKFCTEVAYDNTQDIIIKELPPMKRKMAIIMSKLSNGNEVALCLRAVDESLIKEFKLLRVSQEKQLQALYRILLIEQRNPGALLDYLDTLNNLRVVETVPHKGGG